jgi:hypothetical protein
MGPAMEDQSQPKNEPEPEAAAQADAKPEASGRGPAFDGRRGPGEAYTDRPDFPAPRKRPLWPFVLALAIALSGIGVGVRRYSAPLAPTAVTQTYEVLPFSQKDFDAKTTAAARALLERDKTTHELAALRAEREKAAARLPALPTAGAAPEATPAPAAPAAAPAPEPAPTVEEQAAQELAAAPQTLRDDVSAGKAGFYTFHLAELVDEGGDVYDISVDGAPLLRITTSPELTSITIPMDVSKPHTVTQTLVFARPRGYYVLGPGHGAPPPVPQNSTSFTIRTSAGEGRSHLSSAGESHVWSTQFTGSP